MADRPMTDDPATPAREETLLVLDGAIANIERGLYFHAQDSLTRLRARLASVPPRPDDALREDTLRDFTAQWEAAHAEHCGGLRCLDFTAQETCYWPRPVSLILLAATPAAAVREAGQTLTLDAERLRTADANVADSRQDLHRWEPSYWHAVAAEYARLAEHPD